MSLTSLQTIQLPKLYVEGSIPFARSKLVMSSPDT
jgi:hypothetical protein